MVAAHVLPPYQHGTDSSIVTIGPVPTPMGVFGAVFTSRGLAQLTFPADATVSGETWMRRWMPQGKVVRHGPVLDELAHQLTAYLEGALQDFSIPLDMHGTAFQREVWNALLAIGYGEVWSYGEVARLIGRPRAVRAVGAANGANPVPILVPCHRVIGSNRTLTGYGGGLDLKQRLLRLEGATLPL